MLLTKEEDQHKGCVHDLGRGAVLGELGRFRHEFYTSLTARADALFELTDAVLCADGPVTTLVDLTLVAAHRRGHGAMYDALIHGRVEPERIRRALASGPLPSTADGRIVLAVDVSPWLRSDAATSADRLFCHVYGRGKGQAQLIPGWPYSFVAALEPGRTSWTALLDAVRLSPSDDATAVTAEQLRATVERLVARAGDPDILIVADAGYDITRLAFVLADLPVELLGPDPLQPGPAPTEAAPSPRHDRSPAQARTGVRPRQARDLAATAAHDDHRDHPLRHSDRDRLGSPPSAADPPGLLRTPQR